MDLKTKFIYAPTAKDAEMRVNEFLKDIPYENIEDIKLASTPTNSEYFLNILVMILYYSD